MTRHTAPTRTGRTKLILEVTTDRDESSGYRHEWTTTVRLGLYTGRGPNTRDALGKLEDQLRALVNSPAAQAGLAVEEAAMAEVFRAEQAQLGTEVALTRMRDRARGLDPDRLGEP